MIRGRGNMDNRGGMVGSSMIRSSMRLANYRCYTSNVRFKYMEGSSMIRISMVDRGGMEGSMCISTTMGNSSRFMYSCSILLRNMIINNRLRSSMRLANYRCYTSKVGLNTEEET